MAAQKRSRLFWLVVLPVLLGGCALFSYRTPCEVTYDVTLEHTGSYRAAFDAYMDCLEREENE
jgi:hypothetical protein